MNNSYLLGISLVIEQNDGGYCYTYLMNVLTLKKKITYLVIFDWLGRGTIHIHIALCISLKK